MDRTLWEQSTVDAAKLLLQYELVRRTDRGTIRVRITETEAYTGADDPASHASRGVTERNRLMFGGVGMLYVYFIYGMHYCMNVVAHPPGGVGAVLLRAGTPIEGLDLIRENRRNAPDRQMLNGPGKLAQALGIDLRFNGYDLLQEPEGELCLEPAASAPRRVVAGSRIGISKGTELPWRFVAEPDITGS